MIDWPYFVQNYLSFIDVTMLLVWLLLLGMLTFFMQIKLREQAAAKYYTWNVLFKFVFAFAFALYYGAMLKGGDTNSYWRTASLLADMFYESPSNYFQHLMSENSMRNYYTFFNSKTGYPSSDIYYNHDNYFTSKVFSFLAIITYKGYLAATFVMAFITADIHWRFFKMIKNSNLKTTKWMPILVLFVPSVAFWTSGISKDTLMLISILSIVYVMNSILLKQQKFSWKLIAVILLHVYLIANVRSVILAIVLVPFLFTAMRQVYHLLGDNRFLKRLTQVTFNLAVAVGLIFFLVSSLKDALIQDTTVFNEAMIKQQDFATNLTYGDKKYDLKLDDVSFFGVLAKTPLILSTGIYRPFLWEALSISLILNGIESVVLLGFTGKFLFVRFRAKIRFIFRDRFLNYSFIFMLLTAFIAGFVSILFGVLVRFRAPLLPFIGLLLTVEPPKKEKIADDRLQITD